MTKNNDHFQPGELQETYIPIAKKALKGLWLFNGYNMNKIIFLGWV